ncbi:MAG: hypothetical protein BGO98_06470 [Myxococcales bacterium 68-20]|nr:MAG: hypothetical protein BGO98_06470 [Myxococcales bacterium 68-20]
MVREYPCSGASTDRDGPSSFSYIAGDIHSTISQTDDDDVLIVDVAEAIAFVLSAVEYCPVKIIQPGNVRVKWHRMMS